MSTGIVRLCRRKRPRPAKMKNEGAGDSDDERKAPAMVLGHLARAVCMASRFTAPAQRAMGFEPQDIVYHSMAFHGLYL